MTDYRISIAVIEPGQALTAAYTIPSGAQQGTYLYCEEGGDGQVVTLLDDYHDPDGDFVMSCVAVVRHDAPMQVIFRKTAGWSSIIFECCDAFATVDQHMMPASGDMISVAISEGGVVIDTVECWGQWGLGRWRWQSGPWPYPKDVAALRAKGWLPAMDPMVLGKQPSMPVWTPYEPMHIPKGYPLYVGGGGNPTLFSSVQGYWLCNPDDVDALPHMLEQAEGLAAYPWFMRDCTTWSVPDIWRKYPTKNTWGTSSSYSIVNVTVTGPPGTAFGYNAVTDENGKKWSFQWQPYCVINADGWLDATIQNQDYPGASEPLGPLSIDNPAITSIAIKSPSGFVQGSGMVIDEAHSGSMWPTSWLATGDPYYLEALHAKYVMVWRGGGRPVPRAALKYSQIRQTAWQLTSLLVSAITTPAVTPSWLLPRELWRWLLDDELRLWDKELVHGTLPGATLFHTVGVTAGGAQPGMSWAPWQEDMILQVMSWATAMDPADTRLKACAEWKVLDQKARVTGEGGWCQFSPEGYYLILGPDNWSRWYADWAEAWIENQRCNPPTYRVPGPPDPTSYKEQSPDYCLNCHAGLALATQAGISEAGQAMTLINERMRAQNWGADWHRAFAIAS